MPRRLYNPPPGRSYCAYRDTEETQTDRPRPHVPRKEEAAIRQSDLFIEHFGAEAADPLRFPEAAPGFLEGFDVSRAEGEEGSYRSLFCGQLWREDVSVRLRFVRALSSLLSAYRRKLGIPREGPFLVCGIGNENASADSLGPRAASLVLATDSDMRKKGVPGVCAFRTGVPRSTGMDTARLIRAAAEASESRLIVTLDALCARSGPRLGTVVQITDCGLTPGSALGHSSGEISRRTMPCPVLSIGVPTVIRASALTAADHEGADPVKDSLSSPSPLFVARADTDVMVSCYASLLAASVNAAFSGNSADSGIGPGPGA